MILDCERFLSRSIMLLDKQILQTLQHLSVARGCGLVVDDWSTVFVFVSILTCLFGQMYGQSKIMSKINNHYTWFRAVPFSNSHQLFLLTINSKTRTKSIDFTRFERFHGFVYRVAARSRPQPTIQFSMLQSYNFQGLYPN